MTSFAGRNLSYNGVPFEEEQCAQRVQAENARVLGIKGPPLDRVVWKFSRALPQYNVGHAQRVTEIQSILRTMPNLQIIGDFLHGRSISDCVELASAAAREIHIRSRSDII